MSNSWLGRLACRLGFHMPMESGRNVDEYGWVQSTWGYCLRCHQAWQLDNP